MKDFRRHNEFEKVEIRAGTIIKAEKFPEAKKPAYKLLVDLGDFGLRNQACSVPPFRPSYAYLKEEDKITFLDLYHKDEQ